MLIVPKRIGLTVPSRIVPAAPATGSETSHAIRSGVAYSLRHGWAAIETIHLATNRIRHLFLKSQKTTFSLNTGVVPG